MSDGLRGGDRRDWGVTEILNHLEPRSLSRDPMAAPESRLLFARREFAGAFSERLRMLF
jgi:hypothetical protein